jgi:CheY-like chemotaxis protein
MTKILVIDDDPAVRSVIRQALEDESFGVVEAEDGREGIAQFRAHKPDIVITDIIMPEVEGIETIMTIRQMAPNVRLIAISGGGRIRYADFLDAALHLGADRVLPKPFEDEVLVELIKELAAGLSRSTPSGDVV